MKSLIKVPFLGANDSDCELVEWAVDEAEWVTSGTFLCALETTKATNEVHADFDGFVYHTAQSGQRLEEGGVIGLLSSDEVGDVESQIDALIQQEDAGKPKVEKRRRKS